jgi:hypothetical protein
LEVDGRFVAFEVIDDGFLGVVRVEISVCVDGIDSLVYSVRGIEIVKYSGVCEVLTRGQGFVAVGQYYLRKLLFLDFFYCLITVVQG